MQTITCEQNMLRIPMGEDTLILMRGDRLMITGGMNSQGEYQVLGINEKPVKPFPVKKEKVIEMEVRQ